MRHSVIAAACLFAARTAWFALADRMAVLEGQPNWRSRNSDGRLPALPPDETGHRWHHDATALFRLTKVGVAAMIGDPDYDSDMPTFSGILTDAQIVAAPSSIKSTWPADTRERHDGL